MGQTREERERSKQELQDLVTRVRKQVHDFDDPMLAKIYGMKPEETAIDSCVACNNEGKDRTEVCCYGLYKGRKGGLQWRCSPSQTSKLSFGSRGDYVIDNYGNKTFKRGDGSIDEICRSLGNELNSEPWTGTTKGFPNMLANEKTCKAATKICKA